MKKWQILTLMGLNAAVLCTAWHLCSAGRENSRILEEIKDRRTAAYRASAIQNAGQNLVQDMAGIAQTDAAMQAILARHGIAGPSLAVPQIQLPTPAR